MSLKDVRLEKQITDWAKAYDQNGYLHGSILVAINGRILLNKGYGMANWEHQVLNNPNTKFRIGSITKGFTAMAIFQLLEKGDLQLNDPIDKHLPLYPNDHNITIYHCLTNTSGIPDFTAFPDFWFQTMRLPSTLKDRIDSFKNLELVFGPGTDYQYSTSGYLLLTAIIEEKTGQTYADYMSEHIFLPLGMHDTGCDDGRKLFRG
ncbi:serine hydrolase domain-containing protein [Viridibacillus soli]|uniref:serine hydrolase domain-containing protein n=1 Tax=Viridibacillus soli TaxID=2798301 RepID=UPI001F259853|nr:serine hydrolase domain-containing protein [Viridibacillus soli]